MKRISWLFFLFTLLFSAETLQARGFDPRNKRNCDGDGTGNNDASVKLPVGFPFGSNESTASTPTESGGTKSNIVYSFDLSEDIGPTALHQTRNALAEARDLNADYVLIHISSASGTLDAAQDIKNELQHFNKPVLVYVDEHAIPASQLISSAGDSVYLMSGRSASNSRSRTPKPICVSIAAQRKAEKFNSVTLTSWKSDDHPKISGNHVPMSFFSLNEGVSPMDQVLSHAGLNEMKVVAYKETFLSQLVDILLKPACGFFIIFLFSFFVSLQRRSSLPGPVTFMLLLFTPFLVYPLITGGVATNTELLLLGSFSIISVLYQGDRKLVTTILISGFIISLFLCRTGVLNEASMTGSLVSLLGTTAAALSGWHLRVFIIPLRDLRNSFRHRLRTARA